MCVCVCSPRADVIHSRDGMLCLCHLEVSNSSLSAMFVIYHRVVNMFNSSELISISCDLHAATDAPSRCQHEKKNTTGMDIMEQPHILGKYSVWLQRE